MALTNITYSFDYVQFISTNGSLSIILPHVFTNIYKNSRISTSDTYSIDFRVNLKNILKPLFFIDEYNHILCQAHTYILFQLL